MCNDNEVNNVHGEIETWLKTWSEDPLNAKSAFMSFYEWLKQQGQVEFDFKARPGVSYSLRASHKKHARPLFALIDVVDEGERWLSVCFYADMVNDPEELGDFVPQGLMGQDALCLNFEQDDAAMLLYIQERLAEALTAA